MKTRLYAFFLILLISPSGFAADIGIVKTLSGEVFLVRDDSTIPVKLGDGVYEHDRLLTKSNSSVGILFHDDTRLGAGPDSDFSVVSYHFNIHSHQGLADFYLQAGTIALVAGKIGASDSHAVKVKTPTQTLSVPCSMLTVKVEPSDKEEL